MPDLLVIGDRRYSSWSLRAWLAFAAFGIDVEVEEAGLYTGTFAGDLAPFAPARTVPVLRLASGTIVPDSLAIFETVAERHSGRGHWPDDADARARARALVAEMHAGFAALRREAPMDLARAYRGAAPSPGVVADLRRLEQLWTWAWGSRGPGGWLFGAYGLADAAFAPVAARIATHDLPVGDAAAAYVARHLAHPTFRAWRRTSLGAPDPAPYLRDLDQRPWPGPA